MAAVSGLPDHGGEKESRSESDSQGGQSEAEDRKERGSGDVGYQGTSEKELSKTSKNSHNITKKKSIKYRSFMSGFERLFCKQKHMYII